MKLVCLAALLAVAAATPRTLQQSPLAELYDQYYDVYRLNDPAGAYSGEKSILGQDIKATIKIKDSSTLSFEISGAVSISCPTEAFSYSSGKITLTNKDKEGDCLHDTLKSNNVELNSVDYDTSADHITVKVKYTFVTITLELDHTSHVTESLPPATMALPELVDTYYSVFAAHDPSGAYKGTKSIMGVTVTSEAKATSDGTFSLKVTGPVEIECANEDYTYSNGVITLTNADKAGDCVHDALQKNSVTLNSITYDSSADAITIKLKYTFLTISLEMDHESSMVLPAQAHPMDKLMVTYYDIFANGVPSGEYDGTKTILGMQVSASLVVDKDTFAMTITGPIGLECDSEAYTYSNGVITVTNADKAGDCIHDALQGNDAKLKNVTYSSSDNSITVNIRAAFMDISFPLEHKDSRAVAMRPVAVSSDITLKELIETYGRLYQLSAPAGKYHGSKTILGQKVDATVTVDSETAFDMGVTGPVSIKCAKEAYKLASSGDVTLPNIDKSGDCLHDALQANSVELESMHYDSSSDSITIKLKYTFVTITLDLTHESAKFQTASEGLAERLSHYHDYMASAPSGNYEGTKTVLGVSVHTTAKFDSATKLEFFVTGPIALSCNNEKYHYSNGVVALDDIGKSGDCVHDALQQNKATLSSMTYDGSSDTISVKIKVSLVTITLELKKTSRAIVVPAIAPPMPRMTIADMLPTMWDQLAAATPSGTYKGEKTVLGMKIDGEIDFTSDNKCTFEISGALSVNCKNEAYAFSDDAITFPNISTDGDCLHDALKKNSVTFVSADYNPAEDTITVVNKLMGLKVFITLTK